MPTLSLPIIKGDKTVNNADYRDALPVNFTAVKRDILGASGYLLSHSGLVLHGTGVGVDRGGYWNERHGNHYRVSGTKLISVAADGVVTQIGDITGTKRASMAHSFNTQSIVVDGKWWLYDGTTLTQSTDSDLGTPIDQTWIDGYYFFTDGEFLYHTDILNEVNIDPLKFATSEFSPDPTLAVDRTSDNQIAAFNRYTTEYFINRATTNFAFQRIEGKSIKCGVVGTHCETELEGQFYILGGGREESVSLHVISAGTYTSVATREVDKLIKKYTEAELADAVLETRVTDQDKFIIVRLPNETLLFNVTIARQLGKEYAWTIIKSDVVTDIKWRGVNGILDPRVGWIYGDNQNSNIGILDDSVASQYGAIVESIFYSPLVDMEAMSLDQIEVKTIPGHQVNTGDVTCAVSLTYNGLTYGTEWWALYGKQSDYGTRFIVNRLGYVRERVGFKVRCASDERFNFTFIKLTYG